LAFVLGAGGAVLTACGSENKAMIPQLNANRLKSDLDEVVSAVDAQDCPRSDRALAQIAADLASLPAQTSVRLKHRMQEAVDKLKEQSAQECQETTETQTTDTQTTETETTATQTIPTTTVETTPTTTTPTTTDSIPTTPTTTDSLPTTTDQTGGTGGTTTP